MSDKPSDWPADVDWERYSAWATAALASFDHARYNAASVALHAAIKACKGKSMDSPEGRAYLAARAALNAIPGRHVL